MNDYVLIEQGRIIDPATGRNGPGDLWVENGRLAERPARLPPGTQVIRAEGLAVAPGFIDLHVHLREPGGEEAETIETGSRAAARGGITTVVAMPNTRPPHDTPERVAWVAQRGREVGLTRVLPSGCITSGRAGGDVAALSALAAAGAAAFTDDGSTVMTDALMETAMRQAALVKRTIMDHAQDHEAEQRGVMHEGAFSKAWNLPGIPSEAEVRVVERDIRLAEKTGCRLHIQHVSAAGSVDLIAAARARGVPVTGEVTPHHLVLTDADIDPQNAHYKMNPPLRSVADRRRLEEGLAQGVLTVLATDHAPHSAEKKARGFLEAPFGIIGLETAIGITYDALVGKGVMPISNWVKLWTVGPAEALGMPAPTLRPGAMADVVVMNLETPWTISDTDFASRSRNSPFIGRRVLGRAEFTILGGRLVWTHPAAAGRLQV